MKKIIVNIAVLVIAVVLLFSYSADAVQNNQKENKSTSLKLKKDQKSRAKKRKKKKIDWKTIKLIIPYLENADTAGPKMWKGISPMPLPFMKKPASSLRLGWHETGLYGYLKIRDKKLAINKNTPWKGDSFEIFIENDNAMDHDVVDLDQNAFHIIFLPDTTKNEGTGFYRIYYGHDKMKKVERAAPLFKDSKKDKIACSYKLYKGRYKLEFFIPASMLKPAAMKGRTPLTLNFCVNDDGWPKEQFATDKNVNHNYRHPDTWETVTFQRSPKEKDEIVVEEKVESDDFTTIKGKNGAIDLEKPALSIEERNEKLDIAEDFLSDGKIKDAVDYLHNCVKNYPEDPYFLYNYGLALYASKDYIAAESIFNRSATGKESPVIYESLFQLGNCSYRQSEMLQDGRKNWNNKLLFLRRCIDYYDQIDEEYKGVILESKKKNKLLTIYNIADIFTKRADVYIKEAVQLENAISSNNNKTWKVKDLIEELLKASGNAESDYRELDTFIVENPSLKEQYYPLVEAGLKKVNKILVFSLLTKAKITVKEVEEAGSTQNNNWTIQMYQTALSYYDQVLTIEPDNKVAKEEIKKVKKATCNTYVKEADIELRMATDVVKEDIKERQMKARVKELEGKTDRSSLMEKDKLVHKLNVMKKKYPSSDPEDAIKHWITSIGHFKTAISFNPGDSTVKARLKKLKKTLSDGRLRYADRYMKDAAKIKVKNDEDADNQVKILEKAVANYERSIEETPEKKKTLETKIKNVQKILSRAFYNRGEIYINLAKQKKKTHLDRAVAYLQKATQDFSKSMNMDPSMEKAKKARDENDKIQFAWRKELSEMVAARIEKEAKEIEADPDDEFADVTFDEHKLRDMTIQDGADPNAGYEDNKMPEPIYNW